MMHKFKKGDRVYIPPDTSIFECSDDKTVPVGPPKTSNKPIRALFLNEVSELYVQVIFDAQIWMLKRTSIWELKSLPMIKGDQCLNSSRLLLERLEDGRA
jgi:hypothetical protein